MIFFLRHSETNYFLSTFKILSVFPLKVRPILFAVTQKDHSGREKKTYLSVLNIKSCFFLANHLTKFDYHQSELDPGIPLHSGSCWPRVPERGV